MHSTSLLITLLCLAAISIIVSASTHNQLHQQHQLKMSRSLNGNTTAINQLDNCLQASVLSKPLAIHSTSPMTGYLRNGYCEVPASDAGNHAIAAEVSDEFLKFSADRGNDLRQIGLKGGCKWCLCVSRWKEAFDARGKEGDKIVPK